MNSLPTSRREFIVGTTAALLSGGVASRQRTPLTAQQVADRIRTSVGVPWRSQTVDGFKAGDPSTVVTGIATTVMATIDALKKAVADRQNFIVTQEPTFYSANDDPGNRAKDPVYLAKKAFIDEHRLVVWRFSEHWNARQPNESATALAARLGWRGAENSPWRGDAVADTPQTYQIRETTLSGLVADLRKRMPIRGGLRMVGQPTMRVRTVFLAPGTTSLASAMSGLQKADAIVAGEPREWEAVPYALDTWSAERGKGLIALGRVVSELASTQVCGAWLLSIFPEVQVNSIHTDDPYWSVSV
jgi:putative NIF3 family GTP cyclohydrolase 1 type 2